MQQTCSTEVLQKKDASEDVPSEGIGRRPTFLKNFFSYGREYADYSGLYGVHYLGERKRSIWEKLCWIIVLVVSVYYCTDFILDTYNKWTNSPVILSFAPKPTPMWQIPFPAVTVCPQNKCRKRAYNFKEKLKDIETGAFKPAHNQQIEFYDVALLCANEEKYEHLKNYTINSNTYRGIIQRAPRFDQTVECSEECMTMFSTIITDLGVCFSYNMLNTSSIYSSEVDINDEPMINTSRIGWSLDDGYFKGQSRSTFPLRALPGKNAAPTFSFFSNKLDNDNGCEGSSTGFNIFIHNPGEVPLLTSNYIHAAFDEDMVIIVKPDMMITAEELRYYKPNRRNCYYSTEHELRYYQNYTQKNCEVECITEHTLKKCNCVPYYMPHTNTTKVCRVYEMNCTEDAANEIVDLQVDADLMNNPASKTQLEICNCLPACTSISYNTEISRSELNRQYVEGYSNTTLLTRVKIVFKDPQFVKIERKEFYGSADFLASCGGTLGLFIGFTFLSVYETIYFFTLRIFCNVRRYGKHYWSGSSDLIEETTNNDSKIMHRNDIVQLGPIADDNAEHNKGIFYLHQT